MPAPRRVAVVPADNEERTLGAVLGEVDPHLDLLTLVDDGSRDRSLAIAREFRRRRPRARIPRRPAARLAHPRSPRDLALPARAGFLGGRVLLGD